MYSKPTIYIIGSLRNPAIPEVAEYFRANGFDPFDDWHAAGPHADDCWRDYERGRGRTYIEALEGYAAKHVFEFDKEHLDRCDMALLVMPAGKSAHLELGYVIGNGKPGFILLDDSHNDPEFRYDVMLQFAAGVFTSKEVAVDRIKRYIKPL